VIQSFLLLRGKSRWRGASHGCATKGKMQSRIGQQLERHPDPCAKPAIPPSLLLFVPVRTWHSKVAAYDGPSATPMLPIETVKSDPMVHMPQRARNSKVAAYYRPIVPVDRLRRRIGATRFSGHAIIARHDNERLFDGRECYGVCHDRQWKKSYHEVSLCSGIHPDLASQS
jgi:hypothetical protein